jgi:hypothetical protein
MEERTRLEEVNALLGACTHWDGVPVGGYRVFFDGFVPWFDNDALIGAVKGWPCEKDKYGPLGPQYFVNVLRGRAFGRYEPGCTWDVRAKPGVRHWSPTDFLDDSRLDDARVEIREAIQDVVTLVTAYLDGVETPSTRSVVLIAIDEETGEVLNDDRPVVSRTRELFREDADGQWFFVKQELRWVDLEYGPKHPAPMIANR